MFLMWVLVKLRLHMCLHLWLTFRLDSGGLDQGRREERQRIFQAKRTVYVRALKKTTDTSRMERQRHDHNEQESDLR